MGANKITFLERLSLLTMYAAGFQKEAEDYALELGCSKYYANVLHGRLYRKLNDCSVPRHSHLWERAVAKGKVAI